MLLVLKGSDMNKIIIIILSRLINFALVAVFGYSSVQLFLLINTEPLEINTQARRPVVNQTPVFTPTLNISSLLKTHLFGSHNIVKKAPLVPAPETRLNLKLHGIYYSSDPQKSFAMIAAANGKSASYHIGKSLPGGALIQEIYPRKVILLRNGRHETLRLVGAKNDKRNRVVQNHEAKNNQTATDTPGKLLGDYQRKLRTNPQSLMKLMRISPEYQGGRLVGYRLKPGKDANLLSRFNLQSGDILTTINGVKLDSPLKGLGIIQQLGTANQINLEVLRNGRVVSLSFAVEK